MESTFQWNAKTKVEFLKKPPSMARLADSLGFKPEKILIIFDKKLRNNSAVRPWLKDFPLTYGVSSGEGLKDINAFASHVKKILALVSPFSSRSFAVVALGGGTVGDFAGFLSSVLKRGVPLVH